MALRPDPSYALLVDDDPASRDILGEALYRYGFVPLFAATGAEAIELMAGASAPVLIVLASRLPDMPAAELLATLRVDDRWARARVLLTSHGPGSHVPEDMRVDGVIPKPLSGEALFRIMMTAEPARDGR